MAHDRWYSSPPGYFIAHQLARGSYFPVLRRTDEGEVHVGDWADGFFGAIRLTLEDWTPLFEQKATGEPIMAILLHCTKPQMRAMMSAASQRRPQRS